MSDLSNLAQGRLAHELVHVRQYSEVGLLRYWGKYMLDFAKGFKRMHSVRKAYRGIPFEYKARSEASAWANHHR